MSISFRTVPVYCQSQELSIDVLRDCGDVIAQFSLVQCFLMRLTPIKSAPSCGGSGPKSNYQYMVSWAHRSQHPKRHLYRFCRFCTAHGRMSLYFTMGPICLPQNCPFPLGMRTQI